MNIEGLTNIHVGRSTARQASAPLSRTDMPRRKVNRSPNEEFQARVRQHGQTERLPQAVLALILQKQTYATVKKTGIRIEYQKSRYHFWHENSITIANAEDNPRVLITFDRDDMTFVHVLTEDGRYVESIPQKGMVPWFDDEEMREALTKKAHALNRDLAQYQRLQAPTSREKADRVKSNAEKLQIVNTLPHPTPDRGNVPPHTTPRAGTERSSPATGRPTFSEAETIHGTHRGLADRRVTHERREAESRDRLRRTSANVENLLDDPEDMDGELVEETTRTVFSAENLL